MDLLELLDKLPTLELERICSYSNAQRHDHILRIIYHTEISWTNPPIVDHLQFDISMN